MPVRAIGKINKTMRGRERAASRAAEQMARRRHVGRVPGQGVRVKPPQPMPRRYTGSRALPASGRSGPRLPSRKRYTGNRPLPASGRSGPRAKSTGGNTTAQRNEWGKIVEGGGMSLGRKMAWGGGIALGASVIAGGTGGRRRELPR